MGKQKITIMAEDQQKITKESSPLTLVAEVTDLGPSESVGTTHRIRWHIPEGKWEYSKGDAVTWNFANVEPQPVIIEAKLQTMAQYKVGPDKYEAIDRKTVIIDEPAEMKEIYVRMKRAEIPTANLICWQWPIIRASCAHLSWDNYESLMKRVLCTNSNIPKEVDEVKLKRCLPFPDVDPYRLLKVATEVFMILFCAVYETEKPSTFRDYIDAEEESYRLGRKVTPRILTAKWKKYLKPPKDAEKDGLEDIDVTRYLRLICAKLGKSGTSVSKEEEQYCDKILREKITKPYYIELIWNYWHEEGMLVQSMNAISMRFQNKRLSPGHDPLAHVAIDPLRPLNNILWGFIQDEQHRLSLTRRAYEYDHEYGLRMYGKAIPRMQTVDRRTTFIEAFHNLLHRCYIFFKEDDDTTVIADGYPILNSLKELHLILTQSSHNQYGDLPWTARQEFLMQQYILARPEMREFLPSRIMVDYPQEWMGRVDIMKKLQSWTDVSVLNYSWLAQFGEQILLSVRFGEWNNIYNRNVAASWARYWRDEIQGYINNYQTVTGIDLTSEPVDYTMPSLLLKRQLEQQKKVV